MKYLIITEADCNWILGVDMKNNSRNPWCFRSWMCDAALFILLFREMKWIENVRSEFLKSRVAFNSLNHWWVVIYASPCPPQPTLTCSIHIRPRNCWPFFDFHIYSARFGWIFEFDEGLWVCRRLTKNCIRSPLAQYASQARTHRDTWYMHGSVVSRLRHASHTTSAYCALLRCWPAMAVRMTFQNSRLCRLSSAATTTAAAACIRWFLFLFMLCMCSCDAFVAITCTRSWHTDVVCDDEKSHRFARSIFERKLRKQLHLCILWFVAYPLPLPLLFGCGRNMLDGYCRESNTFPSFALKCTSHAQCAVCVPSARPFNAHRFGCFSLHRHLQFCAFSRAPVASVCRSLDHGCNVLSQFATYIHVRSTQSSTR